MQNTIRMNFTVPWEISTEFTHYVPSSLRSRLVSSAVKSITANYKKKKTTQTYSDFLKNFGEVFSVKNHAEWTNDESVTKWMDKTRSMFNRDFDKNGDRL